MRRCPGTGLGGEAPLFALGHAARAENAGGDDRRTDRAFIGSFTSSGGRGIVVAAVEPARGALTEIGILNGLPDPSYLTVDHAGPEDGGCSVSTSAPTT